MSWIYEGGLLLFLMVFIAEMCVVTLGTLRIIFVSRGYKVLAPVLGFGEIMIWLFAISQVMRNLSDWSCFVGFALGFTLGNFLGILLEKKLALGMLNIRIITPRDPSALVRKLRLARFGVTLVPAQGATGPVHIVMTMIQRKQFLRVREIIHEFDPRTFYAVDELQTASAGIFPLTQAQTASATPTETLVAVDPRKEPAMTMKLAS